MESGTQVDRTNWGLADWWNVGVSFEDYLSTVEKYPELWHGVYERVRLPDDLPPVSELLECSHLLAIAEDWCGDAANSLPVLARLAQYYGIELRVVERDANLELMDQYLTGGRSRAIPVVIAMDCDFNELGWWGSRPTELQSWVMGEGQELESSERYKVTRRWYAKDKGASTIREVLAFLGRPEDVAAEASTSAGDA